MRVYVLADFIESFNRGVLRGVAAFARLNGWDLVPQQVRDRNDLVKALEAADALLLGAHALEGDPLLRRTRLPAVGWSASLTRVPWPRILTDDLAVGRMVADHFLVQGFRKFAFYSDVQGLWENQRREGFSSRVESAGFKVESEPPRTHPPQLDRLVEWLHGLPTPLGVMVVHDPAALALLAACRLLGRRIPEDVAVVGVDNDDLVCEITNPPLSAVPLQTDRIGYEAAALLARIVSSPPRTRHPSITLPPGELVVRRSSDALAFEDADVAKAIRMIRDRLAEGIVTKQVVDSIGTCRKTLDMKFRRALGCGIASEIRRQRIGRARQLLRTADLSMSDVARLAGFSSARQFSETFRHETGHTPSACHRQWPLDAGRDSL